jgi:hypothetical protein
MRVRRLHVRSSTVSGRLRAMRVRRLPARHGLLGYAYILWQLRLHQPATTHFARGAGSDV